MTKETTILENNPAGLVSPWRHYALAVGMLLLVFGSKLVLLNAFASPLPYWDQWGAEGAALYKPYLEGTLDWTTLFSSHNEHRLLFPRLLWLILLEFAGQWDPLVQMMVNAGMHALFAAALLSFLTRMVEPTRYGVIFLFTAITFVVPIGWENTLAGFQAQFYFLLIFSLFSLRLFLTARALSLKWFVALALAIFGYLSMSSGALTVLVVVPVLLAQLWAGVRTRDARENAALVLLVLAGMVMIYFISDVPQHDQYKAHNLFEFASAVVSLTALPLTSVLGGAIVQFPLFWLLWSLLRSRPSASSIAWLLMAIGGFIGSQILSLAWGRAGIALSSRYLDLLTVAYPVSLAVLFALCAGQRSRWQSLVPALWGAIMVVGIVGAGYMTSWPQLVGRHDIQTIQAGRVSDYLATGNKSVLIEAPFLHIPFPDAQILAGWLDDKTIRSVLHSSIRPGDSDNAGVLQNTLLKGRFAHLVDLLRNLLLQIGPALFALGCGLGFLAAVAPRRKRTAASGGG